ncbi:MAG: TIM barrel protein [Candidatus Aenigmarchaeota archaeon]|nr:TIM barrel protein [Candidatus Aenigmarchaeota archaeon]
MKIWIGTAGVPESSKDRSTLGGLKTVSALKLNSMEIEFVRGVKMSNEIAKEVGKLADDLKIRLSIHAPYFINLCSLEKDKLEASKQRILDSAERAHFMHADIIVFHPAYYGKLSEKEAFQKVKEACEDLLDRMKDRGFSDVRLGLETTGKVSQFGTLDEIIEICKEVKGCTPVIDFAHLYARAAGRIDFSEIFDKILVIKLKHLHTHFSGMEFSPVRMTGMGNERRHLNLKDGAPPDYKPLVKEILNRKVDITLISESPNLEGDALFLKGVFEKEGYKF